MRSIFTRVLLVCGFFAAFLSSPYAQHFQFDFKGPDTLFVDNNCEAILSLDIDSLTVESTIGATVTDTILTITGQYMLGDTLPPGTVVTFNWTATDDMGNDSIFVFTITIVDNLAPNFSAVLPADITVNCDNVPDPPLITIFDNCDPDPELTFEELKTSGSCNGNYTLTRTWLAEDNQSNTRSHEQVITVIDTQNPILSGIPGDITVECDNVPDPPVIGTDITATDNCSDPVSINLQISTMPGICANAYTLLYTWTAEDDCGNTSSASQEITVIDTTVPVLVNIPADLTTACDNIPVVPAIGPGGIAATDNCTTAPAIVFSSFSTQNPDETQCDHVNYTITRTWEALDECGNIGSGSYTITVEDQQAPTLYCLTNDTITTDPGTCLATGALAKIVFVSDNCTNNGMTSLTDTTDIVNTSGTPLLSGVVDDIQFSLPFPGLPANYITGNIALKIDLINADAEQPTEFYRIFGEDGSLLGQTNLTPAQCQSSETIIASLTSNQLNTWAADGAIDFTMVPNGTGVEAINQICPDGRVAITLSFNFEVTPPAGILTTYAIDQGPEKDLISGNEQLAPGNYVVTIFAEDCSGNRDSCDYNLVIVDVEAPSITCPNDMTISTDDTDCAVDYILPFPGSIWDNCEFPNLYEGEIPLQSLVFFNEPNAGLVPEDVDVSFDPAPVAGPGNAVLRVFVRGDIANPGEFFEVFGENNTLIGQTTPGNPVTECTLESVTTFILPQAQIAAWSADGIVDIRLVSNKDVLNFSDFVNPCGPLQGNNTDGLSYVRFELDYAAAETQWTIFNNGTNQIVSQGIIPFPTVPVEENLNLGTYTITYSITDRDGNSSSCDFQLAVQDQIAPIVQCKPGLFIKTNPSGLVPVNLTQNNLLAQPATDNCGIVSYDINPSTFGCEDAGNSFNVQLIAFDQSGNSDTCSTLVAIQNEELTPMFSLDTCAGNLTLIPDTTFTYPSPGTGDFFTFEWRHNGQFLSNQSSPVIQNPQPSDAGTYVLTVTGLTGCTATGSIFIDIDPNGAFRPNIESNTPICQGDSLMLTTDWQNALSYEWFNVQSGNTIVTGTPQLMVPSAVASGTWTVRVILDFNCPSEVSLPTDVTIIPINLQLPDTLDACEGDMIALPAEGVNASLYFWTTPDGKMLQGQNPVVNIMGGTYHLRVESPEGCAATDSLVVNLLQRPVVTALSHTCPDCVTGLEDCTLVPSVFPPDFGGTYNYIWTDPSGNVFSTDTTATVSNLTGGKSGFYTLVVEKKDNTCRSEAKSIFITLKDRPITPIISVNDPNPVNPFSVCSGETVVLTVQNTSYSGNVRYVWYGPLGIDTTLVPNLILSDIQINQAGTYTLEVWVNGCLSNLSNEQVIEVRPTPFAPEVTTNSPVCQGDSLTLCAAFVPGANYEWVGPSGTFGPDFCLIIPVANTNDAGTYELRIEVDGCFSGFAEPVNVTVKTNPDALLLTDDCGGQICLNTTPACQLNALNPQGGLNYFWYDADVDTLIGSSGANAFLPLNLPGNYSEGVYDFYLVVEQDGCRSDASVSHTIEMFSIPNIIADAGNDFAICAGDPLELCAEEPTVVTGQWTQTAGSPVTILNPNNSCTAISSYTPGESIVFSWTLSNGACVNYSSDNLTIKVDVFEEAQAASPIKVCAEVATPISASVPVSGMGQWLQSPEQANSGITIVTPSSPTTEVNGFSPGQSYVFQWVLDNGACAESVKDVEVFIFNDQAFAGSDRSDCGFGCLQLPLLADLPELGEGIWKAINPAITLEPLGESGSLACGLVQGENIFVWELNDGICGDAGRDTMVVNYEFGPVANNDIVQVSFGGQAIIDVLKNDQINGPVTLELVGLPGEGTLQLVAPGIFQYLPPARFTGTTQFRYRICSVQCPDICSEGLITISVEEDTRCVVPTIITPNSDGINDAVIIPCLDSSNPYVNNKLSIFNEWGDEVFQASPYQNNWEGTYNGQVLPSGTYFFVFEPGNGEEATSGFILIKY